MTTELRPLSLGELLDRTFSHYRAHFWTFVGIMIFPQLLPLLVFVPVALAPLAPSAPSPPTAAVVAVIALAIVLLLLVYTANYGATTLAVSEIHLGRPVTVRDASG